MKKKTYTNPNESSSYIIEYATLWSEGGRGEKPMRLVVIGYTKYPEFAIRWQDKTGATFGGYSYQEKKNAHNAFLRKYLEHNDSYKEGNISHLPGLNNWV